MTPRLKHCSTRQKILDAAAIMIHQQGYQGTSIGDLLQTLNISKGSLYHHFSSKQSLGYAVFDEIYAPNFLLEWEQVFVADEPITAMIDLLDGFRQHLTADMLVHGCPVNNLAQEMSAKDEGFKHRINAVMTAWRTKLGDALARAKGRGTIDPAIDPMRTASVIVASVQGAIGLAKNAQDLAFFHELLDGLENMFLRLKPHIASPA